MRVYIFAVAFYDRALLCVPNRYDASLAPFGVIIIANSEKRQWTRA